MRFAAPAALATALLAATLSPSSRAAEEAKPKKPKLDLRATPRMAFSPVNVLLTAELTGGDDVEDYYCPELEWDWDDGGKSVHEADCPEYEAGKSKIERRFTASLRSSTISAFPVPLNSSKMTSSMRDPVSTSALAMMVRDPPSSTLRAAPKNRFGRCSAFESTPPESTLPDAGTIVL